MSHKMKGHVRDAVGHTKETIGNTVLSGHLQRSGLRDQAKADAEIHGGRAAGYAEGTKDRVVGKWDATMGALSGDKSMEAKGHLKQAKGDARQTYNNHSGI